MFTILEMSEQNCFRGRALAPYNHLLHTIWFKQCTVQINTRTMNIFVSMIICNYIINYCSVKSYTLISCITFTILCYAIVCNLNDMLRYFNGMLWDLYDMIWVIKDKIIIVSYAMVWPAMGFEKSFHKQKSSKHSAVEWYEAKVLRTEF